MPLLLVVSMMASEPNDAEKLFNEMENKIISAKTLDCTLEVKLEAGNMTFNGKASMMFADGNKAHVELTIDSPKMTKFEMTSNGMKTRAIVDGKTQEIKDTPKKFYEHGKTMFSRAGALLPFFNARRSDQPEDEDEFNFKASDYTLGKKEMVGDKEAQMIQYALNSKATKDPFAITVWIDTKTHLSLKRVIKIEKGNEKGSFTEIYSKLTLDGKIDPKMFEIPKE
jgi:outer membrane lipoprotein-sorting protein